jgi:hypothetical protein
MTTPTIRIELPTAFTGDYEDAVIAYLSDQLAGKQAWTMALTAFDLLDQAVLIQENVRITFRMLYQQVVDQVYADAYITALLGLGDVQRESAALWASIARQIVTDVRQRGWHRPNMPEIRLLLSYLLYWWGAFARGYALEVEIFRDLETSGVQFAAHDLRDRHQRFSPSDLTVSEMAGDIKTSVYFVQAAMPLMHDFYIVRLTMAKRVITLVAMLKPSTWDIINGDTISGSLDTIAQHFPAPVRIRHRGHTLIVLDYTMWKQRILRYQGDTE